MEARCSRRSTNCSSRLRTRTGAFPASELASVLVMGWAQSGRRGPRGRGWGVGRMSCRQLPGIVDRMQGQQPEERVGDCTICP